MWCTRWYIPLLLLPIPTAPPYFLILFLFSLTLHARPCFYCILLLLTLFLSSCYWQPFPLSTPLSVPWAINSTVSLQSFGEALNYTLRNHAEIAQPHVVTVLDRCWCEFSSSTSSPSRLDSGLFDPFDSADWEKRSVDKAAKDLIAAHSSAAAPADGRAHVSTTVPSATSTSVQSPTSSPKGLWSLLLRFKEEEPTPPKEVEVKKPVPKWVYDLNHYGLNLVIDFRWSRPLKDPSLG
ncbi:hypothetical protein DL96DRAFT_1665898 [Flagelloscypha sp. PMI_526]|nr:hypothetical protein DL96DRAFT_1665898 [Flagelloscypha sp. PMI_526]